jgi:hypothetical protein
MSQPKERTLDRPAARSIITAFVLSALLSVGACSSDDSDGGTTNTAADTDGTPPTTGGQPPTTSTTPRANTLTTTPRTTQPVLPSAPESTSTPIPPTRPPPPANADSMIAALTEVFHPDGSTIPTRPAVDSAAATCIAQELMTTLGMETLTALNLTGRPWHTLEQGLIGRFTLDEATTTVATFRSCTTDWELLLLGSVTQGTELLRPDTLRCVASDLPDDITAALFVHELVRPDLRPTSDPIPPAIPLEELSARFDACLAPDETGLLDWN